jgi:preprotein translocase subunit SecF
MKLLRIVPDNTKFGFMRFRRISFPFSALLSVVSVLCFFFVSMNFGIDFTGGTLIEMQAKTGKGDIAAVREAATDLSVGDVEVQEFGTNGEVSLRFGLQPVPAGATQIERERVQQAALERVKGVFEKDYDFRRVEVVGPRVSGELVQSGTLGVVLSVLAVLVYLWFRFEWQFAVGAVIATLHDLVLTIGFFAISQIEFNMTSIAAILTIVGYSLNDTVVVFDRIRELLRKYKRMPTEQLLDLSMNSTLSRTVMTSVTTSLALLALVMFGGKVIQSFSWAMIFGVVIGTYSSIFIAAPVLIYLGVKVSGEAAAEDATAPSKAAKGGAGKDPAAATAPRNRQGPATQSPAS